MIFSCQINKRDRLAPASALRSSSSAAAAAAVLGGPGWKPPAGPGLHRWGRAQNSPQGGERPGFLGVLELQTPLPRVLPASTSTIHLRPRSSASHPRSQLGNPTQPTEEKKHPKCAAELGRLEGSRICPSTLSTKMWRKQKAYRKII